MQAQKSAFKNLITSVVLILILAGLGLAGWIGVTAFLPNPSGPETTTDVMIRRGSKPQEISKLLLSLGVISNAETFFWLGRLTGRWGQVKSGEYAVSARMSPWEIFDILRSGQSVRHPFTIREGANMYEIAKELEAHKLASADMVIALVHDERFIQSVLKNQFPVGQPLPTTLEGYLFPDTYHLTKVMTAEEILKAMTRRFWSEWTPELAARAQTLGLSLHQVVILASMIEKETGAPEERPMISSVFHNRLAKRMRLQSDPTTIYGIWERYTGNLRKADLLAHTPYNTYTIPALPVGPIANPGLEALTAALHPVKSDYLFFVSQNNGRHIFTTKYSDHEKAVRDYQLNAKAREGKSWRQMDPKAAPKR